MLGGFCCGCGLSLAHLVVAFFFFNDTATTEIYTLSLHDALPISFSILSATRRLPWMSAPSTWMSIGAGSPKLRSEEHTSELQSRLHLVCRLLLEKKNAPARPPAPSKAIPASDKWLSCLPVRPEAR